MKTGQPHYQHDCDSCEFIRGIVVDNIYYDVFRCPSPSHVSSWIARFGNLCSKYWSMPWDVLKDVEKGSGTPLLQEMQRIALEYETKERNELNKESEGR